MALVKRLFTVGGLLAIALILPARASAHATLLRTAPMDGSVLRAPPASARFVFDDDVRVASGIRALRNGGGSVLRGRPRVVGGKTLLVPLQHLSSGDYTVLWRIVSADGHTEAGVISFAVGSGNPRPTPSLTASSGPTAREVISRWLLFAGLLVASGGALFRFIIGPARVGVALPAFVAVFLGANGLLPHHGSLSTRFGIAYAVAAIVSAVGALFAAVSYVDRRFELLAWVAALLLLPAPSFAGHALDPGQPRMEVAVDVLHLVAAAVWTGGLVQLAVALRRADARSALVRRFSTVALFAVLVLAVTGAVRALGEMSAVSQAWTTGYGRLLVVKSSLLALLVGLGWINRYRLLPRGDVGSLRRSVSAELVLLTGLVVAVAILTEARPARTQTVAAANRKLPALAPPPLPLPDAVVLAQEDGGDGVTIAAEPGRMRVTVFDGQGLGVDGLHVSVAGGPTSSCGSGCYEARTPARGRVDVLVGRRRFTFGVPRKAPDASALLARATRTFRQLRSVSYVERLASSPRNRIVTTFTLEAPDRVEYHIHRGSSAIVIGTTRWDRTDRRWTKSASTVLPQPSPVWGSDVTNARVLLRTRHAVVVSFLNPSAPAWFTVRFDRRLRPRVVDMTATAHFMHHVYTAFNAPRRIFPPGR